MLINLRLFVKSDSAENGCELTDVVGTAGGGGNGAVNEGAAGKGVDEFVADVACSERGPAIVVTGEGILVASEEG